MDITEFLPLILRMHDFHEKTIGGDINFQYIFPTLFTLHKTRFVRWLSEMTPASRRLEIKVV